MGGTSMEWQTRPKLVDCHNKGCVTLLNSNLELINQKIKHAYKTIGLSTFDNNHWDTYWTRIFDTSATIVTDV